MFIIDAHLDLSWNALQWNRDIQQDVYTLRTQESGQIGKGRAQNTVCLPEMRRGQVGICIATLLARSTGHTTPHIDYHAQAQAYGIAHGQLAYYRALENQGVVSIITDADALNALAAKWNTDSPPDADVPLGFVISMEGADPIQTPDDLEAWYEAGLRLLGPTHYGPGRYAGGTGTELGLTDIGRELLGEMQRLGVLLDLTHLSDEAFWQAVEIYDGPVLASHQNCRELVPHQRQFSDDQLRVIIERDGVIGAAFDCWMLQPGWSVNQNDNRAVSISDVVDHIDHVCQLAGNTRHAAIGTDLDGGFGREQSPHDLDTIADLQHLIPLLEQRGYTQDDIAAIFHGNWLRLLNTAWSK